MDMDRNCKRTFLPTPLGVIPSPYGRYARQAVLRAACRAGATAGAAIHCFNALAHAETLRRGDPAGQRDALGMRRAAGEKHPPRVFLRYPVFLTVCPPGARLWSRSASYDRTAALHRGRECML